MKGFTVYDCKTDIRTSWSRPRSGRGSVIWSPVRGPTWAVIRTI